MFLIFRTASILLVLLTVVTGIVYPVVVTVVAQVVFPRQANGSLIAGAVQGSTSGGRQNPSSSAKVESWVGSDLIGQPFSDPKYFWGRPSSTAPFAYNPMGGSGSNQATTNPALQDAVRDRVANLRQADPENKAPVPVDLVTASGSGLDPHISESAAIYQAGRIARIRKIDKYTVDKLVLSHLDRPTLGILGQSRVNVLKLNLALDAVSQTASHSQPLSGIWHE